MSCRMINLYIIAGISAEKIQIPECLAGKRTLDSIPFILSSRVTGASSIPLDLAPKFPISV